MDFAFYASEVALAVFPNLFDVAFFGDAVGGADLDAIGLVDFRKLNELATDTAVYFFVAFLVEF